MQAGGGNYEVSARFQSHKFDGKQFSVINSVVFMGRWVRVHTHRYQLYLQVKQDILQGRLPVSFELAAELGAYVVQGKRVIILFGHTSSMILILHNFRFGS